MVFPAVVSVGSVTPIALYIALYASVLVVALSSILIVSLFHSAGVQLGAANVAFVASAVNE
jgi:hypothetical protein